MHPPSSPVQFLPSTDPRFSILTVDQDANTERVLRIDEEPVIGWRVTDDPAGVPVVEPLHASLGSTASACSSPVNSPQSPRLERLFFLRYPNGRIESLYEGDGAAFDNLQALLRTLDVQGARGLVRLLAPA